MNSSAGPLLPPVNPLEAATITTTRSTTQAIPSGIASPLTSRRLWPVAALDEEETRAPHAPQNSFSPETTSPQAPQKLALGAVIGEAPFSPA